MITLDVEGAILAALRSPAGQAALADAVGPVVDRAVRTALAEAGDALLDDHAAAAHMGLSVVAWRARVRRSPALAALAVSIGVRGRRWRRSDLDGFTRTRGSKP